MVDRKCAMFYCDGQTACCGKFVDVYFGLHAILCGSVKYAIGIFRGEEPFVAEYVDIICQALAACFRYHFVYHRVNVFVMAEAASYCMRSKECRHDVHRCVLLDSADNAQHLHFVCRVKSVSALDFNTTCAFSHYLFCAVHGLAVQLVFTQGVKQVGRVEYAAASPGYFGIAQSHDFVDKLALAAAGIDNVRMRVAP